MKKLFRKNQIIVTILAVLIAVAGYLNYADNKIKWGEAKEAGNRTYDDIYKNDSLASGNGDIESMDGEENVTEQESSEPGEAVLTNGTSLGSYMVQARLSREQTRSKNKETLLEVINNDTITDNEKKKAVKSMVKLTEYNEVENNIETLLKAKGFEDVIVTISDEQADVIVGGSDIDDAKRAQIEDVIRRKTKIKTQNIVITPAN